MKDAKGHGSDAHGTGIESAVPDTAYAIAKAQNQKLAAVVEQHSATMQTFPRGPMGMTPDDVRATPEFKTANANFDRAFAALRAHNGFMSKNFKTEMKADRDAARQARFRK